MASKTVLLLLVVVAFLALYAEAAAPQKRDTEAETSDASKVIDSFVDSLKAGLQGLKDVDFKSFANDVSTKLQELGTKAQEQGTKIFGEKKD